MRTFEEVLTQFHSFLESATYLDVVPCRWGYVRLFVTVKSPGGWTPMG